MTSAVEGSSYASYEEVPTHRRQWCFWLLWFLFAPAALVILLSGDVYYLRGGTIRSFGLANRIVAGVLGLLYIHALITEIAQRLKILLG